MKAARIIWGLLGLGIPLVRDAIARRRARNAAEARAADQKLIDDTLKAADAARRARRP